MKEITSSKNELVKEIKKLHKKKNREAQELYIIEGFHLVEEAIKANAPLKWLFITEKGLNEWKEWTKEQDHHKMIQVSDEVLNALSELPTPQGILAVIELIEIQTIDQKQGSWLFLDNIQDPGNVGTMIRTADAAGFTGVIVGEGTADIYTTKVLRSMQGSNFHLPIIRKKIIEVINSFNELNIPVYGTALDVEAIPYDRVPKQTSFGLIMGNEGNGVSKELLQKTTANLYIPIKGEAESLNVAVAAGILMYQLQS